MKTQSSKRPQNAERPFEDLLIADISGTVATGYAGKLFADYGARVVNVEPSEGFGTRQLEPLLSNGDSALHGYLHANKASVVTDNAVDHPVVAVADLVLLDQQTLPTRMSLREIETNVCAISWFGLNGPYADFGGSDAVIQALTGLMSGIGEVAGPPVIPAGYQTQILGGLSAFNGALAHLMGQQARQAQEIAAPAFCLDASILEANMCFTDLAPINAYNGNPLASRMGINRFPPTYPLGIWPCKDGWIGVTCLSPAQWQAFCALIGLDEFADVPLFQSSAARLEAVDVLEPLILEALLRYSAEDLFYRGQAMRIPLARVPTTEELFGIDQFVERQAFSEFSSGEETFQAPSVPFRLTRTSPAFGGSVAELGADSDRWASVATATKETRIPGSVDALNLPLQGHLIVDLSMGWAGPLAARNLADLGATVVKVEGCVRFDWWRSWEATPEWIADDGAEKSLQFIYVNRNKLDVTLDLECAEGRDLLLRLVAKADALVENYSGGVLPKLQLDYAHLVKANPALVMVSMPAFGNTGPWSGFRAYGSTVEQASGLPHLNGEEAKPPTMLHVAYGDAVGGLNGTAALLTALYHKKRTGEGQFVDLSQVECLFPLAVQGILRQSVSGTPQPRYGNRHPDFVPHGVYPCAGEDRWIVIQIKSDEAWRGLCAQATDLKSMESLNREERLERRDEIEATLCQWTRKQEGRLLMGLLQQAGVIAAVLNSPVDLMEDPHLVGREYMQFVDRDFVGVQPHPSPPWRLFLEEGSEPIKVRTPAPTLGQHNKLVLQEMLGLTGGEFETLEKVGTIGTKPRLA